MGRDAALAKRSHRGGAIAWLAAALASASVSGCLVDEKCDANQVYDDSDHQATCRCAPNTIPDPRGYGCTPCGANAETKNGTTCECKVGFAKQGGADECTAVVGQELGAPCTGPGSCNEPYPYCAADGAAQYCTDQCTVKSDCENGYRCQNGFCEKVNFATAQCSSSADCAGSDSTYCLTFTKKCLINGCAADTKLCPVGTVCCTFMGIDFCSDGTACSTGTLIP